MPTKKRPGRAGASAPTWPTEQDAAVASKDADGTKGGVATDPYVTVDEAAELLRVVPKTVRNRIRSGDLEAYRHGRRVLIPLAAIERLIKTGTHVMPLVSRQFHYLPSSVICLGIHYVRVEIGRYPYVFPKWAAFPLTSSQFHLFPLRNLPNGAKEIADGAS